MFLFLLLSLRCCLLPMHNWQSIISALSLCVCLSMYIFYCFMCCCSLHLLNLLMQVHLKLDERVTSWQCKTFLYPPGTWPIDFCSGHYIFMHNFFNFSRNSIKCRCTLKSTSWAFWGHIIWQAVMLGTLFCSQCKMADIAGSTFYENRKRKSNIVAFFCCFNHDYHI